MNDAFEIRIGKPANVEATEIRRLAIRIGDICLTRLVRRGANVPDDSLEAPPLPLAFWITDNWWRIRWESAPYPALSADWRLAHDLSSVGAGYAWPNVSLWGEGGRFAIAVHADSANLTPALRFLAEPGLHYLPASTVEGTLDGFVQDVLDDVGAANDGLDAEFEALLSERADPRASTWRRLEAMLGFDPDEAPEPLVASLESLADRFGLEAVGEAALARQGEQAGDVLEACIDAADRSRVVVHPPHAFAAIDVEKPSLDAPWQRATSAAEILRDRLHVPRGPIRNTRLSDLLGVSIDHLRQNAAATARAPYGLRVNQESNGGSKVALRSRWPEGRRFELCRALADTIWSPEDALGPLSEAKSERQKFQRAFAQAFLCPFHDLLAYIDTEQPASEDIQAAARHFHVSERMIQTTLVNNGVIDHASFEQMVDAS